MKQHIRKQSRRLSSFVALSGGLLLLVALVSTGSEAIQHKQSRSDDSPSASSGHSQSAGSGSSSSSSNHHHQNHQPQAAASGGQASQSASSSPSAASSSSTSSQAQASIQQQPQPSYSSSVSISSVSQPASSGSQQQANSQVSAVPQSISYSNSYSGSGQPKYYSDSMSAAPSNQEQSYQAASNSVNMALASSGITGYGQGAQASQQQQQQQQQSSPLNHVHYLYYPGAKESSGVQQKATSGSQVDMMPAASSSNNYQSMAYPSSYADQLSSALGGMNSASMIPEAQASNQDPTYLPQPQQSNAGDMFNSAGQQQANQQQANQNNAYNGDLNSFLANQNQQPQQQQQHGQASQPSVSFNGPTSSGMAGDYMNSHMGHQQQQQSTGQQQNSYQGASLYNQMGDLSTSNFGTNNAGLGSIGSYMSPNQGPQQHQASGQNQADMFAASGSANGQASFSSAASQLSPSAISPPGQQQASGFNMFASNQQPAQAGQSAASSILPTGSSLFSNSQYLNSFLNQAQFGAGSPYGSQMEAFAGQQQQSAGQQPTAAASSTSSSSSVAPTTSKRFGISSLIMPMLALAGLSLLIPTVSSFGGPAIGRKKRSISEERGSASTRQQQIISEPVNGSGQVAKESSIIEYMDKIERYYSIYKNAVENDDCLNRLICEFGDAVKDVTGKSAVVTVIEKLVPNWMTGKVHLFKEAALDNKEGKEKCKKYICQSTKYH